MTSLSNGWTFTGTVHSVDRLPDSADGRRLRYLVRIGWAEDELLPVLITRNAPTSIEPGEVIRFEGIFEWWGDELRLTGTGYARVGE